MISERIFMSPGNFYRIKIEYKHYLSWFYKNSNKSYLHLVWAQDIG